MERTKLLTVAVIGLLLLNLLTVGFLVLKSTQVPQADQKTGPPPGGGGPAQLISSRLHFDEQQQRTYLDMARQHHQQTILLNEKSVRLFQDYYNLLTPAQPDSLKAKALVRQITDIQRQIAELNFAHFQEIKALCRPDQQADFTQLVADLARLFGKRQRPPGPREDGSPGGPPENFPPRP